MDCLPDCLAECLAKATFDNAEESGIFMTIHVWDTQSTVADKRKGGG